MNTAEDAHEVIAAVKYHPAGRRGLAAGTRAALYDSHGTLADHVKAADEATLIAIQLEDQLAIDNIDEPLEIEDVDVFFIGPADLSQSMVTRGIRKHQPSRKLSSAVSARWCPRAAHRARLLSRKNVHEVLEKGVRYIYTHLPRLLSSSAKAYMKNARGG